MFSDRTNWELAPNQLATLLQELRQQNVDLFDLTESNPTRCGFSYPGAKILAALNDPRNLEYHPDSQGITRAREAVCSYYQRKGIRISPRQVFLTSSTSEAYSFLFRLLLNPGEQALFPVPSYPLFQFLVDLNDVQLETYPLVEQGWRIDSAQMAQNISPETKAIVVVNPNNPTGSYVTAAEIAAINQCCQKHDLAIIADEVFFDYAFDQGLRPVSLINNDQSLTFVMGGLSKTLALPQMKLAWIIVNGPRAKVEKAIERLEIIADTYLSINTPVQNAVAAWFDLEDPIQQDVRQRTRRNRDHILSHIPSGAGIECLPAEGGWYAVLRLPEEIDEEALAIELLQKDHVYIHPGYFFDFTGGSYAVVSLLPEEKRFQEGFRRFTHRIQQLSRR